MRRYDEPIHVKRGQDMAAPEQFVWRGRLWLVRDIITRWLETGAWWDSPLVRSARGDDVETLPSEEGPSEEGPSEEGPSEEGPSEETDLLAEHEVWRVLAAAGASGSPGVYELDNARGTGGWRLRAVVD
jgi:hypothetical protein